MEESPMAMIHESVQVKVPVRAAYDQWTQFEEFPKIMHGVREAHQLDETHVRWRAEIWGKDMEWESQITRQIPDKLIEWTTTAGGPDNGGFVEFRPLGNDQTEVNVHVNYEPRGVAATIGNALGVASRTVHSELERYKEFIEKRGKPTGAWRGEVGGERETWSGKTQDSCD